MSYLFGGTMRVAVFGTVAFMSSTICLVSAKSIEHAYASASGGTSGQTAVDDASTTSSWNVGGTSALQVLAQMAVVVAVAAVCVKKQNTSYPVDAQRGPIPMMHNGGVGFGTSDYITAESSMVAPPPPPRASMRRSSNRIDGYPEVAPAVPARSRTNSMVQDDRVDLSDAKESMATPGKEFNAWQLDLSYTKFCSAISRGAFGSVYKAEYEDPNGKLVPVTIQKLDAHATTMRDNREPRILFIFEATILMEFRHPNILWLIGCQTSASDWHLITEHLEYGNLTTVVRSLRGNGLRLNEAEDLHLAQNVAAAMLYLQSKQFILREFSAAKCAVAADALDKTVVKIADFGIGSLVSSQESLYSNFEDSHVALRWMALESMQGMKFTLKSDVWSFGVVLFEIYSYGDVPYNECNQMTFMSKVNNGERPYQPDGCSRDMYALMQRCWNPKAILRPDFYEITGEIGRLQARAARTHPEVRNIGALSRGVAVSPYADLQGVHKIYDTNKDFGVEYDVVESQHASRLPTRGPGAPPVEQATDTYAALDADRAVYGDGKGGKSNVPGLNPASEYYHGVCSRPVAERALLSQGPVYDLDGVFLVRQSPRQDGQMVVSMVYDSTVWHYKMSHVGNGRYSYYGKYYDSIDHIISNHTLNAEKMLHVLTRPCARH